LIQEIFMLKNSKRVRSLATLSSAALLGTFAFTVVACSDDPVNTTKADSGPPPGTNDSGTTVLDSGQSPDSGAAGSLYSRLGGNAGIKTAVGAIVAEELKDPEIASYFFNQVKTPVPAGRPTADQIKACLVNQLGSVAGGPEAYPGVPADNEGFQCRDMVTSHKGLGIPGGVFDKFVAIAAGVIKGAGVADADIGVIGGVLNSTRGAVAQDTTRDGGPYVAPADAGRD
jgi:hypothetical protein